MKERERVEGSERKPEAGGGSNKSTFMLDLQPSWESNVFRATRLGNFHQLVVVVVTVEEGFLPEDHPCEHKTAHALLVGLPSTCTGEPHLV